MSTVHAQIRQQATLKVAKLKASIARLNSMIQLIIQRQDNLDVLAEIDGQSSGEYLLSSNDCLKQMTWAQEKLKTSQKKLVLQEYRKKHGHSPFTFEGTIFR